MWCVFLPCREGETWAVPTRCLAEIVTLTEAGDQPPAHIDWRGARIPVLDLGGDERPEWREAHSGSGRIAVIHGVEGGDREFWALALRGDGLGMESLDENCVEETSEETAAHCTGAFRFRERLYQVPDMVALQQQLDLLTERAEDANQDG